MPSRATFPVAAHPVSLPKEDLIARAPALVTPT
jgi:hypothetical protein